MKKRTRWLGVLLCCMVVMLAAGLSILFSSGNKNTSVLQDPSPSHGATVSPTVQTSYATDEYEESSNEIAMLSTAVTPTLTGFTEKTDSASGTYYYLQTSTKNGEVSYTFTGEKYLTFEYTLYGAGGRYSSFSVTMDGKTAFPSTRISLTSGKFADHWTSLTVYAKDNGQHTLTISCTRLAGTCEAGVRNLVLRTPEEMEAEGMMTTVPIEYNDRLATMTMSDGINEDEPVPSGELRIAKYRYVTFTATKKENVPSEFAPGTYETMLFQSWNYGGDNSSISQSAQGVESTTSVPIYFDGSNIFEQKVPLTKKGNTSTLNLDVRAIAPLGDIYLMVTDENNSVVQQQNEQGELVDQLLIKKGDSLTAVYGVKYTYTFMVPTLKTLKGGPTTVTGSFALKYKDERILYNTTDSDCPVTLEDQDGYDYYVLKLSGSSGSVSFKFTRSIDGYCDSNVNADGSKDYDYFFTISYKTAEEKISITDAIDERSKGIVFITAQSPDPWIVDFVHSGTDYYAFKPSNLSKDGSTSSLTFNITETGILYFRCFYASNEASNTNANVRFGSTTLLRGKGLSSTSIGAKDIVESKYISGVQIFECNVPVTKGSTSKLDITLYKLSSAGNSCFAIWDIKFFEAQEITVNHKASDDLGQTYGTTTYTGTPKSGKTLTFTATPNEGSIFYGWVDDTTGELISTEKTFTYTPIYEDTINFTAYMAPEGAYVARHEGNFYTTLEEALEKTTGSGSSFATSHIKRTVIYLLSDYEIESGQVTIPENVMLVVPYDAAGNYDGMGGLTGLPSGAFSSWNGTKYKEPFRTLTIAEGVTLTIKGTLMLGGVLGDSYQGAQGHTSAYYSKVVLDGNIVVESGGAFDVRGLVTGKGHIEVNGTVQDNKQGTPGYLFQPFLILDYNGGTNAYATFDAGLTPFKMYAMVNIQCEGGYTINYGGVLYGHSSLHSGYGYTTTDQIFIGYQGKIGSYTKISAPIYLEKGAKADVKYNGDHAKVGKITGEAEDEFNYYISNLDEIGQTTITITGGATTGYMDFSYVDTSEVYFAVPYNYSYILKGGDYTIASLLKFMPGSSLLVEEDATLTVDPTKKESKVEGVGLHIYDSFLIPGLNGLDRRTYPSGKMLEHAGYNSYASFVVNGEFVVKSGASFVGTIQNTNGKGKFLLEEGASLVENLHDGVATEYTCNYTEYTLKAQIWDGKELIQPTAGKKYAAADGNATFTLLGIEFKIEQDVDEDKAHNRTQEHNLLSITTPEAEGLRGSWKIAEVKIEKAEVSGEFTYNGEDQAEAVKKALKVWAEGNELAAEDYTVTFYRDDVEVKKLKAAGTYTVKVTGAEGSIYIGEKTAAFEIKKAEVTVTLTKQTVTYNGGEQSYSGEWTAKGLVNGEDKSVLGVELTCTGKDVGTYDVTASYKNGNYDVKFEGTTGAFKIEQATITAVEITTPEGGFVYNGEAQTPELTVNADSLILKEGEYTLTWKDNTDAGMASVTVTGTGNYTGIKEVKFTILPKDIKGATVKVTTPAEEIIYTGEEITVTYTVTLAGYDEVTYETSYANNTDAGTATLTVRGTGNYTGSASTEFTILPKDIKGATVKVTTPAEGFIYNGGAWEPEYTVTLAGYDEVTYETSYDNNTNAGTASVTVTGTGNFTGTASTTFEIKKAQVTLKIAGVTREYGEANQLTYTLEGVVEGDDIESAITLKTTANEKSGVGSYDITAEVEDLQNYTVTWKKATLKVEARKITIKIVSKSMVYTGNKPVITSEQGKDWSVTSSSIIDGDDLGIRLSIEEAEAYTVDTYDITGTAANAEVAANYEIIWENGTYTITSAHFAGLQFNGKTVTYDGQTHTLEVTNLPAGATAEYTCNGEPFTGAKDAGTYEITATVSLANYDEQTLEATLTIEAKEIVVTIGAQGSVYDGAEPKISQTEWTIAEDALCEGDEREDLNVVLTKAEGANAGTYAITGTYENSNYSVTFTDGEYTIAKRELTIELKGQSAEYSGEKPQVSSEEGAAWAITSGEAVEGDTLGIILDIAAAEKYHAGKYAITGAWTNGNYAVTFTAGEYEITKKALTVKIGSMESVPYNGRKPQVDEDLWTAEGLVPADGREAVSVTLGAVSKNGRWDVGEYDILGSAEAQDYTVTVESGTVTIVAAELTVEVLKHSAVYSGKTPKIGTKEGEDWRIAEGTLYGDDLGLSFTTDGVHAGRYTVKSASTNKNYKVTFTGGELEITAKEIEVKLKTQSSVYGDEIKVLQNGYTATGVVSGDDLKIVLTKEEGKDAGQYDIYGESKNSDYAVTFTGGEDAYTIAKREIEVRILDQEVIYGDGTALDQTAWTSAGIVNGDDLKIVLAREAGEEVREGGYAITGSWENGNYSVIFVAGRYTVKPRAVTVSLDSQRREYSGAEAEIDGTAWKVTSGEVKEGDDLGISLTLGDGEHVNVGSYAIAGSWANGNYAVTFVQNYLRIEAREVTVTIKDRSATYDGTEPEVKQDAWECDGILGKDDLHISLKKAEGTDVGEYAITGTYDNGNYEVIWKTGTYTITPKEIKISVKDQTATYNGGIPEVKQGEWECKDLSKEDGADILLGLADGGKDVGEYTIVGTFNNKNYTVTWENGTMTVEKRNITVKVGDQSSVYTGKEPVIDLTLWSAENAIEGEDLAIVLTKEAGTDAGEYAITGTCGNGNYSATFQDGTYRIEKRDIGDTLVLEGEYSDGELYLAYTGEEIPLRAKAVRDVKVTVDPATLKEIGEYTVTATVEDKNYSGSRTFRVTVQVTEETDSLAEVLKHLKEVTGDLTADTLTAEDFEKVKEIAVTLSKLSAEEKEFAAKDLARYIAILDAWNKDIDEEVIETAHSVADALIAPLFGVSALAALAYVMLRRKF